MDDFQISKLIDNSVEKAMTAQKKNRCKINIDEESHSVEHNFVRGLMEVSVRMDNIKWGFWGSVAKNIGTLFITAIVLGLILIAKKYMNNIP